MAGDGKQHRSQFVGRVVVAFALVVGGCAQSGQPEPSLTSSDLTSEQPTPPSTTGVVTSEQPTPPSTTGVVTSEQPPAPLTGNGKIATYCLPYEDYSSPLCVMNADGSDLTILTESDVAFPEWSPDGTQIAIAMITGDGGGLMDIHVIDVDGTGLRRLTTSGGDQPAWSPDGARIAFARMQNGGWELFVINANGTDEVRITDQPDVTNWYPSWSPDGQTIAYEEYAEGQALGVFTINVDGSGRTQIAAGGETPAWSPDGEKIVYTERSGLYTVNPDGSGRKQILDDTLAPVTPAWSPDGTRIVFEGTVGDLDAGIFFDIFAVNADGSGLTRITRDGNQFAPSWQPVP